jgi:hypothetical protein
MIPEASFLFSIAGLSASFLGLAGLVMAFRRGSDMQPIDAFRLRQMVEFSFVNVVVSVSIVPLAALLGTSVDAARWVSVAVLAYTVVQNVLFARRGRRVGIQFGGGWAVLALIVTAATLAFAAINIATSTFGWFELLLVVLLVRPMLPFLLVLNSWTTEVHGSS